MMENMKSKQSHGHSIVHHVNSNTNPAFTQYLVNDKLLKVDNFTSTQVVNGKWKAIMVDDKGLFG